MTRKNKYLTPKVSWVPAAPLPPARTVPESVDVAAVREAVLTDPRVLSTNPVSVTVIARHYGKTGSLFGFTYDADGNATHFTPSTWDRIHTLWRLDRALPVKANKGATVVRLVPGSDTVEVSLFTGEECEPWMVEDLGDGFARLAR